MEFPVITVIAIVVSAGATAFVAYYARATLKLTQQMEASARQHQEELSDLYQAIVIATLLTGPGHNTSNFFENGKRYFKSAYKGNTEIFKES
jgi:type II secretory pathway pseudopilin PulG